MHNFYLLLYTSSSINISFGFQLNSFFPLRNTDMQSVTTPGLKMHSW